MKNISSALRATLLLAVMAVVTSSAKADAGKAILIVGDEPLHVTVTGKKVSTNRTTFNPIPKVVDLSKIPSWARYEVAILKHDGSSLDVYYAEQPPVYEVTLFRLKDNPIPFGVRKIVIRWKNGVRKEFSGACLANYRILTDRDHLDQASLDAQKELNRRANDTGAPRNVLDQQ